MRRERGEKERRGKEQNAQGKYMDWRAKEEQKRKGTRNQDKKKHPLLSTENWGDPVKNMTGNSTFLGCH